MEDDTDYTYSEEYIRGQESKWQVRHNPLYKPKVIPDKKRKKSKEKCRGTLRDTQYKET
jgi:hypothetical protein